MIITRNKFLILSSSFLTALLTSSCCKICDEPTSSGTQCTGTPTTSGITGSIQTAGTDPVRTATATLNVPTTLEGSAIYCLLVPAPGSSINIDGTAVPGKWAVIQSDSLTFTIDSSAQCSGSGPANWELLCQVTCGLNIAPFPLGSTAQSAFTVIATATGTPCP